MVHFRNIFTLLGFNKQKPPKDITAKQAVIKGETAPGDLFFQNALEAINFDEIIQAEGIERYQEMVKDPFVKTALMNKKFAVLSFPWSIKPASDDPRDIEIAQFVEWTFKDMAGIPENNLLAILDALDVGYSITEKNFKIIETGRWKGKVGLKSLKGKDPKTIELRTDDFNNIIGMRTKDIGRAVELDPSKFINFSYMQRYSGIYGTSDLRAAHRAFIIKVTAWRARSIYMQRYGNPTMIGRYEPNATQADQDKLLDVMKTINEETSITIPKDMLIEALQVATSGDDQYKNLIADLNQEILIGIIGSFLMIMEGKETGARAIGEVHQDTAFTIIKFLSLILANVINEEVIKQIVDFNFANVVQYPEYTIVAEVQANLVEESDILETLVQSGLQVSSKFVYERFNIPEPQEGDELLGEFTEQFADHRPEDKMKKRKKRSQMSEGFNRIFSEERDQSENQNLIDNTVKAVSARIERFHQKWKTGNSEVPISVIDALRDGILTARFQGQQNKIESKLVEEFSEVVVRPLTPTNVFESFRNRIPGLSKGEFSRMRKETNRIAQKEIISYMENPTVRLAEVFERLMKESYRKGKDERS